MTQIPQPAEVRPINWIHLITAFILKPISNGNLGGYDFGSQEIVTMTQIREVKEQYSAPEIFFFFLPKSLLTERFSRKK